MVGHAPRVRVAGKAPALRDIGPWIDFSVILFWVRVSEHFVDGKYKLSSASLANARCWATQAHASNLEDQNTTDLFIDPTAYFLCPSVCRILAAPRERRNRATSFLNCMVIYKGPGLCGLLNLAYRMINKIVENEQS